MEQTGQKVSIEGKYTQLQAANYAIRHKKKVWHLLFLTLQNIKNTLELRC